VDGQTKRFGKKGGKGTKQAFFLREGGACLDPDGNKGVYSIRGGGQRFQLTANGWGGCREKNYEGAAHGHGQRSHPIRHEYDDDSGSSP